MVIPPTDIGFFAGVPESYCVRFHRECEKRHVDAYNLTKALIVEFLDGRLVEIEESLDVCTTSADDARPQK
jgi:hypothetical protein